MTISSSPTPTPEQVAEALNALRALEGQPAFAEFLTQNFPHRAGAIAIVELQSRLGLSFEEMAAKLGITLDELGAAETGQTPISSQLRSGLAKVFGLELAAE